MRFSSTLIPAFALTFAAASALSQATSGDLVGTVRDSSGAAINNAVITVTSESTGVAVKVDVTASGEFRASNLLPANYDIQVTAPGFQAYELKGVLVELNKTSTTQIALAVGTAQSTEVIAESGVVLDTTSTNLSQTFSAEELTTLPTTQSGTYGVLNASLLSPGVAAGGGIGIGTGPSVGGQRPRNNNFTIEGIDNNSKSVTGPLVYLPSDATGEFTLITNQFSPEFGHSSGGQFNTNVQSGTNHFHGAVYEYFQNRNLNAALGTAGQKQSNTRYDNNRYGGQLGGPILHDKLFFFGNYERNSIGSAGASGVLCTPTADGLATLKALASTYNFSANNLAVYEQYMPASSAQVTDANDGACFNQKTGPQTLSVYSSAAVDAAGDFTSGASTAIPMGNYPIKAPSFSNFWDITTGVDYTLTSKDSVRVRYLYNNLASQDTAATLPVFWLALPNKWHLFSASEFHTFTSNLTNEIRLGYNRNASATPVGPQQFPGISQFPNLTFVKDQNSLNLGPDGNAPQSGIQNLYQVTDNVSYVHGKHTMKVGFDGRKYIAPQTFTQRVRGDYQWNYLSEYLHDVAPTAFGQRSTGNVIYYGDQTALYGYANDTWRATPTLTLNAGLRYEFTSIPTGERAQVLNAAASVPGLVTFKVPQPQKKNFAPRIGVNWAPDSKTSIRAGYGIAYDVLFDNLGLLTFPPQYSSTNSVGDIGQPAAGQAGFLAGGGLPSGGTGVATFSSVAKQRAATSATVPDQVLPYAETYTLTVQRTIGSAYTAEVGYVGTRGIHLATQDQINVQPRVTTANQLTTVLTGPTTVSAAPNASTLAQIQALSRIVPAWQAAGFTSPITSYQPFSQSDYNGLVTNLQRRYQNGLQANVSYTWSKTMDDATAEVFATVLTPRRAQNSQCISCDYSRSALDATHRFTAEVIYDVPFFKHSSFLMKNLVGNWAVAPIYTYQSPEYATVLSGVNSNLNGDSGAAIDRTIINPTGVKGTSSKVTAQYASNLANLCKPGVTQCAANTVGYVAVNPNAYYIQAGAGTLPNSSRNTLPVRPINDVDVSATKKLTFFDHYNFNFSAQVFNILNHAQYIPGSIDSVAVNSYTSSYAFQTAGNSAFNQPQKAFGNNPRSVVLNAKFLF